MSEIFSVALLDDAIDDIDGVVKYIQVELMNSIAARNINECIFATIDKLSFMPSRNRIVIAVGQTYIRRVIVKNYSVFYYIDDSKALVHVIAVLYSRRDFRSIIKERIK